MGYYEHECSDPGQSVHFAFDKVLLGSQTTAQRHEELMSAMNSNGNRWQAKYLLQGSKSGIQDLTLRSLEKKASEPWSERRFLVKLEDALVTIYSVHEGGLDPLVVWRVEERYFLIDYQDNLDAHLPFARECGVVQIFLGFEDHRLIMEDRWRQHKSTVHCTQCGRDYGLERCGSHLNISEESSRLYAVFQCPSCGIGALDSVSQEWAAPEGV